MKVKIGDMVFDSATTPIMVTLSSSDKENIVSMPESATTYAVFPEGFGTPEEREAWMQEGGKDGIAHLSARISELEALCVMGFWEEQCPTFTQGYAIHEMEEPLTAEQANGLVQRIRQLS